ncbi:MAG: hypothetical protein NWS46_00400 [Cyclobacteriaceae bacterium]|nr:hypothetical protein [Cyclobacteriaceae bacterium]
MELSSETFRWLFPLFMIGVLLFHVGSFKTNQELISEILFTIGIGASAYFLHKRTFKNVFATKVENVEKLIEAMENDD